MTEGADKGLEEEQQPGPYPRLFDRLGQIPGYVWDRSQEPYRTTYDCWHVSGVRQAPSSSAVHYRSRKQESGTHVQTPEKRPALTSAGSKTSVNSSDGLLLDPTAVLEPIVARISTHVLRLEREYHLCKALLDTADPEGKHIIPPIDLINLPAQSGDRIPLIVLISQSPGRDYLRELDSVSPVHDGSLTSTASSCGGSSSSRNRTPGEQFSLQSFLDFAIGASECLEILHHGPRTVHGELRAEAFHFNKDAGLVKLVNFGSGARTYEHGLTSSGWSSLSRTLGVKDKLQYIAPEQTGRMSATPDGRTDIYSLGILFWVLLVGEPVFDGQTPMEIVQSVLSKRIPPISSRRMDIPDAISVIIQKMTSKQIDDRYHSSTGLKYDLCRLREILGDGDTEALKQFQTGTKDASTFFNLPKVMVGRREEHDIIASIIEKVADYYTDRRSQTNEIHPLSSRSSTSGSRENSNRTPEVWSNEASSQSALMSHANSDAIVPMADYNSLLDPSRGHTPVAGNPTSHRGHSLPQVPSNFESSLGRPHRHVGEANVFHQDLTIGGPLRSGRKRRGPSECEVISIAGSAGLGKSCLVQSVQAIARRRGYLATAKFDQAQKQPFEPVLRVMSLLFRQIFSEGDVTTEFHQLVRSFVAPVSSVLQSMLDIPEDLLGNGFDGSVNTPSGARPHHHHYNHHYQQDTATRLPSYGDVSPLGTANPGLNSNANSRARLFNHPSPASLKPSSIFLEILRLLARQKFICLCFDDLQFADEESLELISSIVAAKIQLVVIATYRDQEILREKVRSVLESENARLTKIKLAPLKEENIIDYVSATLYRPREYVVPLVAVLQEKTAGNPFLLKEVLDTCHRKNCIWFDWKASEWSYDLDRVFRQLETDNYGETLNNDFILRRLNELPGASRVILAWASLIGTSFSFSLVQNLMSSEFDVTKTDQSKEKTSNRDRLAHLSSSSIDSVAGLQAAIQAAILVSGDDDDQFRFVHDRYMQASVALRECYNAKEMHYVIAQTMMKDRELDDRTLYVRSEHVSKSIDIIQARVNSRGKFRDLLVRAGQKASESGARTTALFYYRCALSLLQADPWVDGPDKSYDETLRIYTRLSECLWYLGDAKQALGVLDITIEHARSSIDKVSSGVLQSRIYSQSGNTLAAFRSLELCLSSLGLDFEADMSWEQCDAEFQRLCSRINKMNRTELLEKPASQKETGLAMGAVLIEIISAAFWTDALMFYQLVLRIVDIHWSIGGFAQVGLGYAYVSIIATGRFDMVRFGVELSRISLELLTRWQDNTAIMRGAITYWFMLGHLESHVRNALPFLQACLESNAMENRLLALIEVAVIALNRFYTSDNLNEIEGFCAQSLADFPGIAADLRGGPILLAVRQVVRALQGKTGIESSDTILSDELHDSRAYVVHVANHSDPDRALDSYHSLALIPLYLYEYYDAAVSLAESRAHSIDHLWSMRASRLYSFYLGLSHIAVLRQGTSDIDRPSTLDAVQTHIQRIQDWEETNNVNYVTWSSLLKAELCDATGDLSGAMRGYDTALTHAQDNGFILEEALTHELAAGFYARQGVKRTAKDAIKEAIIAYCRLGAHGKANQVSEKFAWLTDDHMQSRVTDRACQTEFQGESGESQFGRLAVDENDDHIAHHEGMESAQDRTRYWINPDAVGEKNEVPGLGIDVIDLQSILNSSQVMSSELEVNKLLPKMCKIILGGNSADFAAIILDEEDLGWSVVASGDHEAGVKAYNPGLPLASSDMDDRVAKRIALYCLRFREAVFLQNLLLDERFSNFSEKYLARNPLGRSVIALPIVLGGRSLLGAVYLEGPPSTFTDRNLTVLQLLVNQIGISISNALLFKQVSKVSAANTSMIESQKRALAQAREAELKAKYAESEAIRNLALKEEAAKAKSIFLANVSHELRTPLNGMIGNSELLKGTQMTAEQESYADSIRVCADTLLTVINDILDYSKLEAGKMQLVPIPYRLREAIRSVIRAISSAHAERKIETVTKLNLPNVVVLGDPIRLHQILMNLLSNSYKFTPSGTVTVRAETDDETDQYVKVVCSVTDTGIGINPEQLQRLFTPFSQADNSTARRYGGSGLGLSICKSLIEVMNGDIWIESEAGVGTTVAFHITLPKAPEDALVMDNQITAKDPEPASPGQRTRTIVAAGNGSSGSGSTDAPARYIDLSRIPREKIRICIAEDNPINQKIAITFVQRLGFQADAYDNGREAVEALRRKAHQGQPYHLVLMDVQMPELDGYEATREIRADESPTIREVLIIAMTASAITGDREKCIEAGMNNYLAKPVRAHVLKSMLEKYLRQPERSLPSLQREADDVARSVLRQAGTGDTATLPQLTTLPTSTTPTTTLTPGINDNGAGGEVNGKTSQ